MMELHILGTASARPTSKRNVSGSVLSTEEGLVVIDAGEGFQNRYSAQRSLMKRSGQNASLRPHKIAAIALTHGHLDHTWGLLPFLQTLALDGRNHPLIIYAPTSPSVWDAYSQMGSMLKFLNIHLLQISSINTGLGFNSEPTPMN